jgi:hypothetical protein
MNGNRWHELSTELQLAQAGEHQLAEQEREEHQYRECDHSCAAELR